MNIEIVAKINDSVNMRISGDNLPDIAAALQFFGLATPNVADQPAPAAEPAPASTEQPAPTPAPTRGRRAKKEEPAPLGKPADAETTVVPAANAPTAPDAPSSAAPTPADAAQAVRAYAAKNGIDAARALLAQFGFARTGDITADQAPAIVLAAGV